MTLNAAGTFLYVAEGGGLIDVYAVDASSGALTPIAGNPFPTGNSPDFMAVNTVGTLLYVSATGGGVAGHAIDLVTGALTPLPGSPFTGPPNTQSVVITS